MACGIEQPLFSVNRESCEGYRFAPRPFAPKFGEMPALVGSGRAPDHGSREGRFLPCPQAPYKGIGQKPAECSIFSEIFFASADGGGFPPEGWRELATEKGALKDLRKDRSPETLLTEKLIRATLAPFPSGGAAWWQRRTHNPRRDFRFMFNQLALAVDPRLPLERVVAEWNRVFKPLAGAGFRKSPSISRAPTQQVSAYAPTTLTFGEPNPDKQRF